MRPLLPLFVLMLGLPQWAAAESRVPASAAEITLTFAPVVRAAAPAVVNVYAERAATRRGKGRSDLFDDGIEKRATNSLGSGVLVAADGIVVSNYHVVAGADSIRVVLSDRREYEAGVLLSDQESDLAILRLKDASRLPWLPLRDSDEVEVGDLLLAVGNPFGLGQTVSQGIVSGLARSGVPTKGGRGYFIQTDAAINPGNSGGALVDTGGRLVGVSTAVVTPPAGSQGIGFAIPANLVKSFLVQATAGRGRFVRPWAGIDGRPVTAAMARVMDLPSPAGMILSEIHPDSPFGLAGLRAGDVVVALAGRPAGTPQEIGFRLSVLGVGGETTVTYLRNGVTREARVALTPAPEVPPRERLTLRDTAIGGVTVERINPAVAAEHDLPLAATGVAVASAAGRAEKAGLRPGDVILSINARPILRPADVREAAAAAPGRWHVEVLRDGRRVRLKFAG